MKNMKGTKFLSNGIIFIVRRRHSNLPALWWSEAVSAKQRDGQHVFDKKFIIKHRTVPVLKKRVKKNDATQSAN